MLTLITVNYNSPILKLLRSLEAQTDKDFAVIVVDNDSRVDQRESLGAYASASPLNLDVIYHGTNGGFAAGNNIGIRKALAQQSPWVVLINPDTTPSPDFIASLRAHLPHQAALVAIPLHEGSVTAYGGRLRWLRPSLEHITTPVANRTDTYVIGGGMAIAAPVLDHIGLLDERYFLYFEDVEYTLRARTAGVPVVFATTPVVDHAVSQSTSALGAPMLLYLHMRNALLVNRSYGPWWVQVALPAVALYGIIAQFVKYLVRPAERPHARAIARGIMDFYANRFGPPPHHHWH